MTTLQPERAVAPRPRIAPAIALVAIAVGIAILVGLLFLGVKGSTRTAAANAQASVRNVTTTLGTGAGRAHLVINPETGQAHGTVGSQTPPVTRTGAYTRPAPHGADVGSAG